MVNSLDEMLMFYYNELAYFCIPVCLEISMNSRYRYLSIGILCSLRNNKNCRMKRRALVAKEGSNINLVQYNARTSLNKALDMSGMY